LLDQRARVPVLQNRAWPDRAAARAAPTAELDVVLCATCGFAWNRAFISDRVIYDQDYNNDQMGSARFRAHADAMLDRVLSRVPQGLPFSLIEVGCGQGAFLAELARSGCFASLTGFDPAWRGKDGVPLNGFTVHRRYLESDTLVAAPPGNLFVVSRHTIEHVANPLRFLRTIRAVMNSSEGRLFLETPDIEWIIRAFQPQDLFYEHCSIFSRGAMLAALAAAGFETLSIDHVFDGQYLWAEARPAASESDSATNCTFASDAATFAGRRERFVLDWHAKLDQLSPGAKVYLWGAASKGVTFAALLDPDGERLAGAIDINPAKVGNFMPLTGLPIVPPSHLRNGDTVITMNPNYRVEIAREIDAMGIAAQMLSADKTECAEQVA
jgi:hypothetical protein